MSMHRLVPAASLAGAPEDILLEIIRLVNVLDILALRRVRIIFSLGILLSVQFL